MPSFRADGKTNPRDRSQRRGPIMATGTSGIEVRPPASGSCLSRGPIRSGFRSAAERGPAGRPRRSGGSGWVTISLFLGAMVLAGGRSGLVQAGRSPPAATCSDCHTDEGRQFGRSVHSRVGFDCRQCHGGAPTYAATAETVERYRSTTRPTSSPSSSRPSFDHGPGFREKPARVKVPELCGDCRSATVRSRRPVKPSSRPGCVAAGCAGRAKAAIASCVCVPWSSPVDGNASGLITSAYAVRHKRLRKMKTAPFVIYKGIPKE